MKRIIITGPTGAIGMALVHRFLEEGDTEVTAVCRRDSRRIHRLPSSARLRTVACSLEELRSLPGVLSPGYDVFYHLAWACTTGDSRNDIDAQLNNIRYTLDAVEAAAGLECRRFVGAGSQAEYGRHCGMLGAGTPVFPENGYGIAKLGAGLLSRIRCGQLGVEHIWARILSVYGPYDGENTLVSSLIRKLLGNERPRCTAGEQVWDYIYAKDAARAMSLLGERGVPGRVYCIGSGEARPLREYVLAVRDAVNPGAEIGFGEIPYSPGQVMHLQADITGLSRDTGFRPEYSFEEGIAETVDWVKDVCTSEED